MKHLKAITAKMTGAEKKRPERQYPPVYEKVVPIALILLAIVVVGVLFAAFGFALGLVV